MVSSEPGKEREREREREREKEREREMFFVLSRAWDKEKIA